jgi:hypothetical protein
MITTPVGKAIMVALLSCILLLTSCAANYKSIDPRSGTLQNDLHKGDVVRLLTKSGKVFTFEIVEISEDMIRGEEQEIPLSEIFEIKKLQTGIEQKEARKSAFYKYFLPLVASTAALVIILVIISRSDVQF